MDKLISRLESNRALTFASLAAATMVLVIVGVVGLFTVSPDKASNVSAGTTTTTPGSSTGGTTLGEDTSTTAPVPGAAGPVTTARRSTRASGTATPGHQTVVTLPSSAGATRTGVSASTIKYGLHAPKTLQGAPWGLADDALKGVRVYLNQVNQQKVNGRTLTEYFADDRYDTGGGAAAGDTLINDDKVFFAEGTLGVDQIAQVAKKARESTGQPSPTPYMAAGGAESKFKDIGMYQVSGSYDSHLVALAHFLDAEFEKPNCAPASCPLSLNVSPYGHLDGDHNGKMKVGISALNSEYIVPAVDSLKVAIQQSKHLELGPLTTVEKPEGGGQTGYTNQVLQLRGSDVVIPAQDPLSTSGEVKQCSATCGFLWTFSNFAHDGDVDLALMGDATHPGGSWTGYRGLSSGCYYLEYNTPRAPRCSKLAQAHDLWIHGTDPAVDNGGGDKGDGSAQSESTWRSNGQSGVAGYQVVHFWLGALKQAGPDLTREKFVAALNAYSGYDDLITQPITFAGSPNKAHGINGFAVYQAGPPDTSKPKGVGYNQLSDGLAGF